MYYNFLSGVSAAGDLTFCPCDYPRGQLTKTLKCGIAQNTCSVNSNYPPDFAELVESCVYNLASRVEDDNYLLFGHSMGAYVAYEVGLALSCQYDKTPHFVVISGQRPPCRISARQYPEDKEEGIKYLNRLGGLPDTLLADRLILDVFLTTALNDIRIMQTYQPGDPALRGRLPQGAVIYGSRDAEIDVDDLELWGDYFQELTAVQEFAGDHFYINTHREDVLGFIDSELMACRQRSNQRNARSRV